MVNRPIEIDGIKYFKCKKCGEVKPLNKCYFHINTMFSTGFNSKCKSCVREEVNKKPKVKYITRAELEEENRKLKDELEETKNDLEHRDSFFSIMRDVLANEEIDNTQLAAILYCVVHLECGDLEMSKKEVEIAEKFWFRDYV